MAQLILAVLLVPTALALAIGRTLWRRPVFLVAVVMPWSSSHGERGRGRVPRASAWPTSPPSAWGDFPLELRGQGRLEDLQLMIHRYARVIAVLILPAMALLIVSASELVGVLFERGALSPADTAATASILTASILRIYALGLLGQTLVNIAVLPLFSIRHLRPTAWYLARAALAGLVVTAVVSLAALPFLGVQGLAAGNAAGISVLALLLLRGTDKYVGLVDVGAMKVVPRSVRGAPTERLESLTRRTGGGVRTERKGRSP